jgi:hypothetical protein
MLERATTLTAFSVPVLRQEHWYAVAKPPCSQPHPGQPPGFAAARWWCALCSARMRAWRRRTLPSIFPVRYALPVFLSTILEGTLLPWSLLLCLAVPRAAILLCGARVL